MFGWLTERRRTPAPRAAVPRGVDRDPRAQRRGVRLLDDGRAAAAARARPGVHRGEELGRLRRPRARRRDPGHDRRHRVPADLGRRPRPVPEVDVDPRLPVGGPRTGSTARSFFDPGDRPSRSDSPVLGLAVRGGAVVLAWDSALRGARDAEGRPQRRDPRARPQDRLPRRHRRRHAAARRRGRAPRLGSPRSLPRSSPTSSAPNAARTAFSTTTRSRTRPNISPSRPKRSSRSPTPWRANCPTCTRPCATSTGSIWPAAADAVLTGSEKLPAC